MRIFNFSNVGRWCVMARQMHQHQLLQRPNKRVQKLCEQFHVSRCGNELSPEPFRPPLSLSSSCRAVNLPGRVISVSDIRYSDLSVLGCGGSFWARSSQHLAMISARMTRPLHTTRRAHIEEDGHTKSVTVWSNLRQVTSSPVPALTLGFAGLLPFLAAPAYMITSSVFMPEVAFAQVAYGATILSFLGGVRWGFVLPEENPIQPNWVNLGYSVAPPVVAWIGLLLPPTGSLLTVLAGLGAGAYGDMAMYGYPAWYKGMRFLLSFGAILSLWSTLMCGLLLSSGEPKPKDTPQELEEASWNNQQRWIEIR